MAFVGAHIPTVPPPPCKLQPASPSGFTPCHEVHCCAWRRPAVRWPKPVMPLEQLVVVKELAALSTWADRTRMGFVRSRMSREIQSRARVGNSAPAGKGPLTCLSTSKRRPESNRSTGLCSTGGGYFGRRPWTSNRWSERFGNGGGCRETAAAAGSSRDFAACLSSQERRRSASNTERVEDPNSLQKSADRRAVMRERLPYGGVQG